MQMRRTPFSSSVLTASNTVFGSTGRASPITFAGAIRVPKTGLEPSRAYRSCSCPLLTSKPSLGPVRCARAFEVIVVDQRIRSTWLRNAVRSSKPKRRAPSVRQSRKQTVRSWGVVSTFTGMAVCPSLKRPSVRVPPTSMSTVYMCVCLPAIGQGKLRTTQLLTCYKTLYKHVRTDVLSSDNSTLKVSFCQEIWTGILSAQSREQRETQKHGEKESKRTNL